MFFTPDKPVSDLSRLVGRHALITSLNRILARTGQHVFLFGPKGIGKTSVVSCLSATNFDRATYQTATQTTTFGSLFREILNDLQVRGEVKTETSRGEKASLSLRELFVRDRKSSTTAEVFKSDISDPNEVRRHLSTIKGNVLIVIDNLEKVENRKLRTSLFEAIANLSKLLSDTFVEYVYKIVLVGTAYDITSFVPRHHSINRIYSSQEVAPVSIADLAHFLSTAGEFGHMVFEPALIRHFAELSFGYPYFVQAIGSRIEEELQIDLFEPKFRQSWYPPEKPLTHVEWDTFIVSLRSVCEEQVLFYRQMYGMMSSRKTSHENRIVYSLADHIAEVTKTRPAVAMPLDEFLTAVVRELGISADAAMRICEGMAEKRQFIFLSSGRIGFIEPVLIPFLRASLEYQRRSWQRPMSNHPELPFDNTMHSDPKQKSGLSTSKRSRYGRSIA